MVFSMRVAVLPERCTGCRVCELVCSVAHEGEFRPAAARIQVLSFNETVQDLPIVCQQCSEAPCLEACPSGALTRDEGTGAIVVNWEECLGCGACVEACVVGSDSVSPEQKLAIRFYGDVQAPIKCDLCGGDPQCVKYCPTHALILTDAPPTPQEITVQDMTQALICFLRQEEPPAIRRGR